MTSKPRIAIVGAGWAADKYMSACRALEVEIAAVCSRGLPRARALALQHGFGDVTVTDRYADVIVNRDVDIVIIASSSDAHAEQAVAAAEHGKHVVVEKPVTLSLPELARVVDAIRRNRVRSTSGFVQRSGLYQQQIKEYVVRGLLGDPFFGDVGYVSYQTHDRFEERPWMRSAAASGSSFLLSGIHAVDTIRWLMSTDPVGELNVVEVVAQTQQTRLETDYPDFAVALLRFANGATGVVSSHLSSRGLFFPPVTMFGDQGTVRGDELWTEVTPGPPGWLKIPQPHPTQQGFPALYTAHLARFLAALDDGAAAPTAIESTINTHEVCFAADESARSGRPVRLPLRAWEESLW